MTTQRTVGINQQSLMTRADSRLRRLHPRQLPRRQGLPTKPKGKESAANSGSRRGEISQRNATPTVLRVVLPRVTVAVHRMDTAIALYASIIATTKLHHKLCRRGVL